MNTTDSNEEFTLHAFIDGELDSSERERLLKSLAQDRELRKRACELQQLKEMVRHAYSTVQPPEHKGRGSRWRYRGGSVAAALLLFIIGFFSGRTTLNQLPVFVPTSEMRPVAAAMRASHQDHARMFLNVDEANGAHLNAVLDRAEELLKTYGEQDVKVEVIFRAAGLHLLRTDISPHIERMQALLARYDNLRFVACNTTLRRWQELGGGEVPLLTATHIAPSGIDYMIERVQEGWTYVRI